MYCRQCGKEVKPDARFCGACGASIGKAAPSPPFASRISPKVWIAVGSLAVIVLIGLVGTFGLARWNEHKATRLFAEANQLVQKGQDAEETSYGEAFEHYKAALDNAQTILLDYRSTSPAARLLQDPTLGPHTLKELQDTIVPEMQKKAALEGDPLGVARFLLNKVNSNKDSWASGLAGQYAKAGRYDDAMELIETVNGAEYKTWALLQLVTSHGEAGHVAQARELARTIPDPDGKVSALLDMAKKSIAAGQLDQAGQTLGEATELAYTILDAKRKIYAISAIAMQYAFAGQVDGAQQLIDHTIPLTETIHPQVA